MATRRAWTVGEVFEFPCDHGGWGARQVVRANKRVEAFAPWARARVDPAVIDALPCLTELRQVRVPW